MLLFKQQHRVQGKLQSMGPAWRVALRACNALLSAVWPGTYCSPRCAGGSLRLLLHELLRDSVQ